MANDTTFKVIAVDGGAATGKSSTSRAVAQKLKLLHVDTGAHYRTLTFALLKAGSDPKFPDTVTKQLEKLSIDTQIQAGKARLSINGTVPKDSEIRSTKVNENVSQFAAIASVRSHLFNYQRTQVKVAKQNNFKGLIMEGRDIGSIIFPDADFRFFFFANEATRAARRAKEGQVDSIAERDKMDSSRKTAPLTCPEGATRVDTGSQTLDQVIDNIVKIITGRNNA